MPSFEHLKNAPIIEALVDLRVKPSEKIDLEALESLESEIIKSYPVKKEKWIGEIKFEQGKVKPETGRSNIFGYIYLSEDEKRLIQVRLDGFTLNWLEPYESWEKLRDESKKYWKIYASRFDPVITRVAVRFINNLRIPLPINDFGEYLTAPPIIPTDLPQELHSFLNRVVIQESESRALAIVTQALERVDIDAKNAPVILDIDVNKEVIDDTINEEEVWELLETMRNFKNEIFFKYITEKTVSLFR